MAVFRPGPDTSEMERVNPFRGINLSVGDTEIAVNESPDMLNMELNINGAISKRAGYKRLFDSIGIGAVNGLFLYRSKQGVIKRLLAHGTKLYLWTDEGYTELYTGIANTKVNAFMFNDKLHIQDGTNYLEYDGTTVKTVEAYIPTLTISGTPTGGGTKFEDWNLIGNKFKETFSGNGTSTTYQMSLTFLEAIEEVKVNGSVTTSYTVNLVEGKVIFNTAPSTGVPNNVEITARKSFPAKVEQIAKCKFNKIYGGTNDTRVFLWGSDNNTLYRSDVYRANYFPENSFQKVGSDSTKIMNITQQYDTAIIHKEFSKWAMSYQVGADGKGMFPVRPINDTVGCNAPYSTQLIENNPVNLTTKGVYMLVGGAVRDERNVQHISHRVDRKLLLEPNLASAISIDYNQKYYLVINNNAYIYDYRINEWYIWDNIKANCFIEIDNFLYFGSNQEGIIYKFTKIEERNQFGDYLDDGQSINAYWKSKVFNFGHSERRKMVQKLFYSLRPDSRTGADLYILTNKSISPLLSRNTMNLFEYNSFDYADFSYLLSNFPQEVMTKVKAKKIVYFQVLLQNNRAEESMGILSIGLKYKLQNEVK